MWDAPEPEGGQKLRRPVGAGEAALLRDVVQQVQPGAYDHRLPHTEVEAVVPAYCSFTDADAELGIRPIVEPPAEQRLSPSGIVGWELLVPEDNEWSDEKALGEAAQLARTEDYRAERLAIASHAESPAPSLVVRRPGAPQRHSQIT